MLINSCCSLSCVLSCSFASSSSLLDCSSLPRVPSSSADLAFSLSFANSSSCVLVLTVTANCLFQNRTSTDIAAAIDPITTTVTRLNVLCASTSDITLLAKLCCAVT